MPEWLKKLLNKLDDPELMLEQSYREFESRNKESEIQKAYTKKQAFLARRKAEEPHFADPTRATLIIIAIMTAWALIGIFINIKGH
jgi:hypothetical protein